MRFELTEGALNELGKLFTQRLKNEIKKKQYPYAPGFRRNRPTTGTGNKYASGELYNSISYKVVMFQGQPALEYVYADYFDNVNKGTKPNPKYAENKKGKRTKSGKVSPFIQAILKWISIRGIRPKGYKGKGRYSKGSKLGLALAIRKNIFRYGIAPAGLIDKTYDKLENLFENPPAYIEEKLNRLGDALAGDITNLIDNTINE
jgi:hypothetical protein